MAFSLKKRSRQADVPTDSMSDIAFLLIIFFILTTSIQKLTGFQTELPAGQKAEAKQADKTPTVQLAAGRVMLNEKTVSIEELAHELKEMKLKDKPDDKRVVLLDAGPDVDYQTYFETMALITGANGVIGILTEDKQ